MSLDAFGVDRAELSKAVDYDPKWSMKSQGVAWRDKDARKATMKESRLRGRAVLPGPDRKENQKRLARYSGAGAALGAGAGLFLTRGKGTPAATRATMAGLGAVHAGSYGTAGGLVANSTEGQKKATRNAARDGRMVRADPSRIKLLSGDLKKDAGEVDGFGVTKRYTRDEGKQVAGTAALGAGLGGVYLSPVGYVGAGVGGQAARNKANRMASAARNPPDMDAKFAGNPGYEKWRKASNLADRGATEGERAAARGMADKLSAKHGPFTAPKAKKLGAGYKVVSTLGRMANPRTAAKVGVSAGIAAGAGLGAAGGHSEVKRARKVRAARHRRP